VTPQDAIQIKNDNAVDVRVVNGGLVNASVLSVSVGEEKNEDKTKALRPEKGAAHVFYHARKITYSLSKNRPMPRQRRPTAPNAEPRTSGR
jgi:hypothetical protein